MPCDSERTGLPAVVVRAFCAGGRRVPGACWVDRGLALVAARRDGIFLYGHHTHLFDIVLRSRNIQGVAIPSEGNDIVELYLACLGRSVVRLSVQIPRPSLASVVGSLCISSSKTASSSALAEHARAVLDADSQMVVRSKRLGKVAVGLGPDDGGDGDGGKKAKATSKKSTPSSDANALLQKSAQVTWTPAMSSDVEALEDKLAGLLKMDGTLDAKAKTNLVKTVTAMLEKCKQRGVSMASAVSARALVALIGTCGDRDRDRLT